jgi:RNA polymerase sigma-70 factor (ECF subfamily)
MGAPAVDADDDALLARDLIEGRPDAALLAWRRFYPLVANTLRRMLGPGGDLQDLAQEVFLRFFTKVNELRNLASLRAFLMGIAVRRAQEEIKQRRMRRWFGSLPDDSVARQTTTEMDPENREAILHFYRVIDRLSVTDRTIYVLRYIEGLEQAPISETMGISVSTVRRRLAGLSKRVNRLMSADPVLAEFVGNERPATETAPGPDRGRR